MELPHLLKFGELTLLNKERIDNQMQNIFFFKKNPSKNKKPNIMLLYPLKNF
jgi:hypothetical protein